MEIVTSEPIEPNRIYDEIQKRTAGSVVFHYAVVRGQTGDKITTSIEFQVVDDVEAELRSICERIRLQWEVEDLLIIRRIGLLQVGDVMSLVAASAPHREDAFEACRYGVESLKVMDSIEKIEL